MDLLSASLIKGTVELFLIVGQIPELGSIREFEDKSEWDMIYQKDWEIEELILEDNVIKVKYKDIPSQSWYPIHKYDHVKLAESYIIEE